MSRFDCENCGDTGEVPNPAYWPNDTDGPGPTKPCPDCAPPQADPLDGMAFKTAQVHLSKALEAFQHMALLTGEQQGLTRLYLRQIEDETRRLRAKERAA